MATWAYNPPPPHRLHTTTRISPSQALTLLQTYISASSQNPALQPNALLTEKGPISATGSSSEGITLRNLKRVEAGIRGVHLEDEIDFALKMQEQEQEGQDEEGNGDGLIVGEKGDDERLDRLLEESRQRMVGGDDAEFEDDGEDENEHARERAHMEGWQSMESYKREQRDLEGEIGVRDNAVRDGGMVPRVKEGLKGEKRAKKRKRHSGDDEAVGEDDEVVGEVREDEARSIKSAAKRLDVAVGEDNEIVRESKKPAIDDFNGESINGRESGTLVPDEVARKKAREERKKAKKERRKAEKRGKAAEP